MLHLSLIPHTDLPELTEHQPVEFVFLPEAQAAQTELQLSVNGIALEAFLLPGDTHWRWRWNTGAAPGRLRLTLTFQQAMQPHTNEWMLLVVPLKMEQQHYAALIDDIQQLARSLIYALNGGALAGVRLVPAATQRWELIEERAAIFSAPLERLEQAIARILRQPRSSSQSQSIQRPIGEARSLTPDSSLVAQLELLPEHSQHSHIQLPDGRAALPHSIHETQSTNSVDSYEHRLLKRVLERLLREARLLQTLLSTETASSPTQQELHARLHSAERRIAQLRSAELFEHIGELSSFHGPTPLLQRDSSYREIFRMWQALRLTPLLLLDEGLLDLPINELPRLYEQWCALQLCTTILGLGWELSEQHMLRPVGAASSEAQLIRMGLRLDEPIISLIRGSATLRLRYQARYRPLRSTAQGPGSLDQHTRIPDLALELTRPGKAPTLLIFDAKYRLSSDTQTVPIDALDAAYAYLGSLGYAGQPISHAAYILYPGQSSPEHYASRVGALPLLPGQVQGLNILVRDFLATNAEG